MDTDIILGGTVAGLAAGMSGNAMIIDELLEGPSGTDFAYCVPLTTTNRTYKRPKSSEWARGDAARRAYQFYAAGLTPMPENTSSLVIDYLRRESGVVAMPFVSNQYVLDSTGIHLDLGQLPSRHSPLAFGGAGEVLYLMLDPARFAEAMASFCRIKRGYRMAGVTARTKTIRFNDYQDIKYGRLINTLPLDYIMRLALPNVEHPVTATALHILNVGMKLSEPCPVGERVHQACFWRNADTIIDSIDFYSHVDYEAFAPTHEKRRDRIAIAVKHYEGLNEVSLSPKGFASRIEEDLKRMGFIGEIEAKSYHYLPSYVPTLGGELDRKKAITALEEVGIYSLGGSACGHLPSLEGDIRNGLGVGLLLA